VRRHHPQNERVKREYLTYLEQAKRMSTVDSVAGAIALFEEATGYRDLRKFRRAQAISFKEKLQNAWHRKTGRPLAKSTILSRLMPMKDFITWLQSQPSYRSRITYGDAEYFNPSANDQEPR